MECFRAFTACNSTETSEKSLERRAMMSCSFIFISFRENSARSRKFFTLAKMFDTQLEKFFFLVRMHLHHLFSLSLEAWSQQQ
jgi:hypothetical protein